MINIRKITHRRFCGAPHLRELRKPPQQLEIFQLPRELDSIIEMHIQARKDMVKNGVQS